MRSQLIVATGIYQFERGLDNRQLLVEWLSIRFRIGTM